MNISSAAAVASFSQKMKLPDVVLPFEVIEGEFQYINVSAKELTWPAIRTLWVNQKVQSPFCFAPPEAYLSIFFYYACRQHRVPASLGSVYNPDLADFILHEAAHDCLVITDTILPYLTTNELFFERLKDVKLLICIGDLPSEACNFFSGNFKEMSVSVLGYPIAGFLHER